MTKNYTTMFFSTVALILVFTFAGQPAKADWGVSFYGEVSSPRYSQYSDRITSEYRRGYQLDDWVERGSSSVTDSPVFNDGVRLTSWATPDENDNDFALASAIYFFEVPDRARSVRVKIYYDGEADRGDFNGGITGRVWVRRAYAGDDYTEYYPDEGRYEDADQPLYGDTFVLRAKKNLEILRMSAEDHTVDGIMELHLVAEGRQRIDVKYIEVETYSYLPSVSVVTRYYKDYTWKPWYNYTYWYFYTGPTYHFADHYYVRYTYPRYRHNYITIRKRYNDYLRFYYVKHPDRHVRWANVSRVNRGTHRTWDRNRLGRWTREHEEARKTYIVSSSKKRRADEVRRTRTKVRSVLTSHSRVSPATSRARSGITSAAPATRRRRAAETRSSTATDVRSRTSSTESARQQQYRNPTDVRTRTETSRSSQQTRRQIETPDRTRTSSSKSRSSVQTRTRSNASTRKESVKQAPTKSRVRQSQQPTTQKREATKTRTVTRTKESPTKSRTAPSKSVETKKDDDDDDDDKKKKRVRTR